MNPHFISTQRAFTLIELLTVIAIIGILAAIIIPTVGSVRDAAKASACISSLRQVGLSAITYASDNKNYLPYAGTGNDAAWAKTLAAYINTPPNQKSTIFVCPGTAIPVEESTNPADIVLTYGMHAGLMPRGLPALSLSKVARMSEVILVADMCQDPNNKGWTPNSIEQPSIIVSQSGSRGASVAMDDFISTATDDDTGNNKWMRYRHKGKVNVAMCDGHAVAMAKGTIKNRNVVFTE
ncbi:MAG: hypothetical protein RIQ79_425 [Verrucomicrobiota bacterium]|jgi:prepilin-type N-terminal cleavage/methylation domain-containing protein/prepilin-type processing-associated H-X9-DG protein